MSRVRRAGTSPELVVRRIAREFGVRYTTKNHDLPGSPDLANRRRGLAIFVHGCYWHRHANCAKASTPKTNQLSWKAKFSRNVERDRAVIERLETMGYRVGVFWECDTKDLKPLEAQSLQEIARGA